MSEYYKINGQVLTDIADAIRVKTGDDATLTPSDMVSAISGISVSTNSTPVEGMETGTLDTYPANYWGFTIPVTSKKTHVVVWPANIAKKISIDTTGRHMFVYAVEGDGHIQACLPQNYTGNSMRQGVSRWYNTDESNAGYTVFNENSIEVHIGDNQWASDTYLWCAW